MNKIKPFVDQTYWLKSLDTDSLELMKITFGTLMYCHSWWGEV